MTGVGACGIDRRCRATYGLVGPGGDLADEPVFRNVSWPRWHCQPTAEARIHMRGITRLLVVVVTCLSAFGLVARVVGVGR